MSDIFVGRVLKVHQHDNSLDIQLSYDDSVLTGVPLIGPMMTTSSGVVDMHHPEGNTQDGPGSKTRDSCVIVARTSSGFIALGFLSLQVNQMAFNRKNFKVDRHASDVYHTIDNDGNVELSHPSGTFVRVASSPAHEDLTGKDTDKLWQIDRNKAAKVWLSVVVANAGKVAAEIKIDPKGNISILNNGKLTITSKGSTAITASDITINGQTTINGNTAINGNISLGSSPSGKDVSMIGNLSITGNLSINDGVLTNNDVDVGSTHKHGGVKSGGEKTSIPV